MIIRRFSLKNQKEQPAESEPEHPEKWESMSTEEMTAYISETYHAPQLETAEEISAALKEALFSDYPQLGGEAEDVHRLFGTLKLSLEEHCAREEGLVFPRMREAKENDKMLPYLVRELESDNEKVLDMIRVMEQKTAFFTLPKGAGEQYVKAYRLMPQLFAGLKESTDFENRMLFPAFDIPREEPEE